MECGICKVQQAKYKCPTCSVRYCSLVCFKSENHFHVADKIDLRDTTEADAQSGADITNNNDINNNNDNEYNTAKSNLAHNSKFRKLLGDAEIKAFLSIKNLQFHLSTVVKILNDPELTNEPTSEGRREIANKKLCNLRTGGIEENVLVEEFIARVFRLLEE